MVTFPECDDSLKAFIQLCAEHDLLTEPEGLEKGDLYDGLSDPSTLLYVALTPLGSLLLLFLVFTSTDDF